MVINLKIDLEMKKMKKVTHTILTFIVLGVISIMLTSWGNDLDEALAPCSKDSLMKSTGANAGYANDPYNGNKNCTNCHTGTAVPISGLITTNIPGTGYVPGVVYNITTSKSSPGIVDFGFQTTAQNSSGTQIGTLAPLDATTQAKLLGTVIYIDQTGTSNTGTNGKSWTYKWTAPVAGSGSVTFYGVFLEGDGAGTGGDVTYISSIIVNEAISCSAVITPQTTTTFCQGGSVNLGATTGVGYTYQWLLNGSNIVGATSSTYSATQSGSYTLYVTNGACNSLSSPTNVTVNSLPLTPTISASGSTTFCTGGSVTLTSSAGSSYLWSTGATTTSINITTPGSYTVQVTNASGCQSAPSTATNVTVNALPIVNAGTNFTIPSGTGTTIDATVSGAGSFTYSWTPSALLVNSTVEDPTTVNLTSTTVFTLVATSTITFCNNSSSITITVSGGPLSSFPTTTSGTICAGTSVQLDALASGGSGNYSYSWTSNPAGFTSNLTNPMVNPMVSTSYFVEVNDGFSSVNSQVDVSVNNLATGSQTLVECQGFSVTVGTNTYNTSGIYNDVLVGSNGCDSTVTTDLTIEPAIDVSLAVLATTLTANQVGANYRWLNCNNGYSIIVGETSQSFTAVANGDYAAEITVGNCVDTSACENITTVGINEITKVVFDIYPNPASTYIYIDNLNNPSTLNFSVKIFNHLGQIVANPFINQQKIYISTSTWTGAGIYFIQIIDDLNNAVYSSKIILQ